MSEQTTEQTEAPKQTEQLRIGELLIRAGIVSEDVLQQRLTLAKQLGLPIGTILVQQKDVSKNALMSAIQIQTLILEGALTIEQALLAIQLILQDDLPLDEAIVSLGLDVHHAKSYRLGELLLEANVISEEDLAFSLMTSSEIAAPLGHVLIQTGVVKPDLVALALTVQKQIRAKILTSEQAIEQLKASA